MVYISIFFYLVVSMNLVLNVTLETYSYHSEAAAACSFDKRVLCDLDQLQDAVDIGGKVPEFEWGWFAIEDRAATLNDCDPGIAVMKIIVATF